MTGVATALWTMGAIVAVGWALARFRLLGPSAAEVLARVTFAVAIPALLVVTVAHADLHVLISRVAVVTALATGTVALVAAVVLRRVWRLSAAEATVGTLAATYLNAAHLGIPVAVYVVGDAVAAVPTLLFQQLVLAPVAFAVLDRDRTGRAHGLGALARSARNPVLLASLAGLVLAALPWSPPEVLFEPLRVLGGAAAPMALVAFGMSLAVRRPPGGRWVTRELALVAVLRAGVHPALAAGLGLALGLDDGALLAVVAMAALPTAQNVLVYALRYGRAQALARDAGVVTTLLAAPVLVLVAALLA